MALIENFDALTLGYTDLDSDHQEFIALLNELEHCSNEHFPELFRTLMRHTERHFERENQLMDQYNFPATTEHKGEHHRVLSEFKQFAKRVDRGLLAFGRSYVKESLPQWLDLHVKTMDSALVAHIQQ